MTTKRLILLRNLPMVDVIEYRIETDGWTDDVEAWCDQLAEDLFGISERYRGGRLG